MNTPIRDLMNGGAGTELGDRPHASLQQPTTPGIIAQTNAEGDPWANAAASTPDVTNMWVPDGYQLTRNAGGLPFCIPQPAYIAQIAREAPSVMNSAVALANELLGDEKVSNHREASQQFNESLKGLIQTLDTYNLQFAYTRNLVYAIRNGIAYQSVVLTEQLDQLQRQVERAEARGIVVSESQSINRAREFANQTLVQLYVGVMALGVFDPKDIAAPFNPNWERTAQSYCNKRGENFTRSVLHKNVDPKAANTVDTFQVSRIASILKKTG